MRDDVFKIIKLFVCLNAECFCLFNELLLTWISSFLWKQPSMILWVHNHDDDYHYQFAGEFHHHFVEAATIELIIMLITRDDVFKTMKFLFIWMLTASIYLLNCRWQKFQGFCGSNHTIYETRDHNGNKALYLFCATPAVMVFLYVFIYFVM